MGTWPCVSLWKSSLNIIAKPARHCKRFFAQRNAVDSRRRPLRYHSHYESRRAQHHRALPFACPRLGSDESQRAGETAPRPRFATRAGRRAGDRRRVPPRRRIGERARPTIVVMHASVGLRAPQRGERRRASLRPAARRALDSRSRSRRPRRPSSLPAGPRGGGARRARLRAHRVRREQGRVAVHGRHTAHLRSHLALHAHRTPSVGRRHRMEPHHVPRLHGVRPRAQALAIVCTHITAANVAVAARMLAGQHSPSCACPPTTRPKGSGRTCPPICSAWQTSRWPRRCARARCPRSASSSPASPHARDFRRPYDRASTRERFGLAQDKLVVLALAGAYLPRPYVHFPRRTRQASALPAQLREGAALRVRGGQRCRLRAPSASGVRRAWE